MSDLTNTINAATDGMRHDQPDLGQKPLIDPVQMGSGSAGQFAADAARNDQARHAAEMKDSVDLGRQSAQSGVPPLPRTPAPELADHMARERQGFKDWVRMELHLFKHDVSHEDRVAQNP
jgi:hypothetical protein